MQTEGTLSGDAALSLRNSYKALLTDALSLSACYSPPLVKLEEQWGSTNVDGKDTKMVWPGSPEAHTLDTGVGADLLREVGRASVAVPEEFVSAQYLEDGRI